MGFMHGAPMLLGNNTVPGVQLSPELKMYIPKILQACRDWGLDFYPTVVQLLTYDEISEIAAYGGFPVRFPHWSFGMEYEELQRGYEFGMHKIYEMVINCWVRDTQVISKRGSIPVQEVRVGDELFSGSGSRKVVAVVEQPLGDVVRIKLRRNLQEIICTPNHKLMAYSNGVPQWVEAGKLKSGDVLLAGGDFKDFMGVAPEIKWDKSKVFESTAKNVRNRLVDISPPDKLTLELAEILGLCVGDGSTGTPGTENVVAVSVGKDSKYDDYRFRIESLFNKVFGCKPSVYEKANCWSIQMDSKYVVDFLDEVGLFKGVTFESKCVPPIIWASSNEYRAAFLKGVFDTDGSASGRSLAMSSMSKNLVKDIQLLLMEMGIASQADKIDNKHNNIWTLCINGPWNKSKFQSLIGFSIPYKQRELESQVLLKTPGKTGLMIEGLQKEISNVIDSLPNQNKLPTWVRRFRYRNNSLMGTDPIWGFVQKMCEAGYVGFDLFLNLLEKPMYAVEEVSSAGQEKTWDIALDHDDHDFLANGLISHNTNPCYIYNLSSNTLLDHLTVVAHATGHNDFFKNNIHFSATDTNMLNKMANHGTRIRKYMARWGKERVTEFLDWVMRLETLVDGAEAWTEKVVSDKNIRDQRTYRYPRRLTVNKDRMYMEPFINTKEFRDRENERIHTQDVADEIGVFKEPTKNILAYLRDNAPLKPWQADIISMLYEEAIYFFPQRQTKTINEGWASMTDSVIMAEQGFASLGQKSHDCGIIEYADHKMGVLGGKYSMNPYKLGYYLLKDIRSRWDKGQFGTEWDDCTDIRIKEKWDKGSNLGKEKIFEVRKYYDDFTLLHEFFTEDFCREQEYFHWSHYPNGEFKIDSRDFKEIKRLLMRRHLNGGLPDIRLTEPNYRGNGSMFLQHNFDGRAVDGRYVFDVLTALRAIWGEDVFLATETEDGEEQVYCCYGTNSEKDVELVSRAQHLKRS